MHAIILAALCALALSQGAPTCGPNTHFNDCASACPKTCDDPNPTMCVMMCVSTCECDDGYLLNSDSTCVPAEACLPASTEAAPATSGAASSGAPMPGGHSPVDATSELVMQAATCAIAQWNAENSNNLAQQLSHIVAGTQQVVAGVLYNLVLATSPVGCVDDCPTQLMAAQIWLRPWLTESCVVQNITLIDAVDLPLSTAAPAESTVMPETSTEPASSDSAPASSFGGAPGGPRPLDPSSASAVQAALCAVSALNAQSNAIYQLQLVRIVSGTSQVVSGARYSMRIATGLSTACRNDGSTPNLQRCPVGSNAVSNWDIDVVVQPWQTPSCNVISTTAVAPASTTSAPASTAQPLAPLGSAQPLDINSAAGKNAALCAVSALNTQSNSIYQLQLVRIVSGTSQLVAGTRYAMRIATGLSTTCRNDGSTPDLQHCPVGSNTVSEYDVVVLVQPWQTPSCNVLSTTAVAPSTPTPMVGGSEPVDVASTEVTDAAVCAVAALNARSNSVYQLELVDVITGTQQVVAGMRYHLTMTVASAKTCLNNGATPSLATCPVDLSTAAQYTADVVVTPWATPSCTVLAVSAAVTGDQSMGVFTGSSSSSSSSTSPALWAAVGIATALIVATGVVYVVRARAQRVSPPSSDALGERLLQDDS
eukprot:m.48285 g.48285  ORF g.48285 m.48285 type:complete len:652 (-) comp6026_c0_seq1:123-2078(-)